jgi:hypothetical protein
MKNLFLILLLAVAVPVCAQTDRTDAIKALVDAKSYDFHATTATAMDGDGISFTTKDFSYDSRPTKKGGWEITIRPKDDGKRSVTQLYFSIRSNGLTTIRVMAPHKDPITFDGEITSPGAQ